MAPCISALCGRCGSVGFFRLGPPARIGWFSAVCEAAGRGSAPPRPRFSAGKEEFSHEGGFDGAGGHQVDVCSVSRKVGVVPDCCGEEC